MSTSIAFTRQSDEAICGKFNLRKGHNPPQWLTPQADVVLFALVYCLGGCDFLPAIHSMPFKVMFSILVDTVLGCVTSKSTTMYSKRNTREGLGKCSPPTRSGPVWSNSSRP